ncbi:MAG: hypothetical protein KAJ64_02655 [Thermoplasmata archaeon]|nr:hypothetical protein [Thermoplasmata archaeon]
MKTNIIIGLIVFLVLASSSVLALTADLGYGNHPIDVTIQANQDVAYVIDLEVGDKLIVDLEVFDGGPVDFYLTNKTAYGVYQASVSGVLNYDSFYFVEEYSRTSTGRISYTYDSIVANELVVLVDNSGNLGEPPIGPVTVSGTIEVQRNVWTWQNILITAVLIILIIAFMLSFRYPKNKKNQIKKA